MTRWWTLLWRPAQRRERRRALTPAQQSALRAIMSTERQRRVAALRQPLAAARWIVYDLETTGPFLDRSRIIAIGAVAIQGLALRHDETFGAVVRQDAPSSADNILVHRISGQQQVGGRERAEVLLDYLGYRRGCVGVAFRAEFDATVMRRECEQALGFVDRVPTLDLAVLLPAFFPGTANDTLGEWVQHFKVPLLARHDAASDAYATAQLFLVVAQRALRTGAATVGDLFDVARAQVWLGRRR